MRTPDPNHYELLGVSPEASQTEIKSAFRQQVMRNHPDQGGNPVFFRMLEEAYETLISPTRRSDYDSWLAGDNKTPPGGTKVNDFSTVKNFDDFVDFESGWDEPTSWINGAPAASGYEQETTRRPLLRGHGTKVLCAALLAWIVFVVAVRGSLIPGLDNSQAVLILVVALLAWTVGSLALRLLGWMLVIFALVDAHWHDAPAIVTLGRVAVGFCVWLCGQWFYTWRKGTWHSIVAFSVLRHLPNSLRPDRRWQEMPEF